MSGRRAVRRARSGEGRMTGATAMAMLGVAELTIIGVLIVLPMLTEGTVEVWQIVLCAVLLLSASTVFVVKSFVKIGGKWQWRWATR